MLENNTTTKTGLGGENVLFWTHLSQAQFIPFGSTTYTTAAGANGALAEIATTAFGTVATANAALQVAVPQLRIRDTGYIHAFGLTGLNYYIIGSYYTNGGATGALTAGTALSPREALGIDEKVDDGKPDAGVARASGGALASMTTATLTGGAASPAAGNCYDSDAPATYATASEDVANSVGCSLRIRAGF